MKLSFVLIVSLACTFVSSKAGVRINYPVDSIAAHLLINADVIIRKRDISFTLHKPDRATYEVHEVFTILNEKGMKYSNCIVPYSKLQNVSSLSATLYDMKGNKLRKLKQSDIYDQSAISGFSLYEDNRIKVASLSYGVYPYTVEFTYSVEFLSLFYIPSFALVDDEKMSVESASYVLKYSEQIAMPRYKVLNTNVEALKHKESSGYSSLRWEFSGFPALKNESMSPPLQEIAPMILTAPSEFRFDGYDGRMDNWDGLGRWIQSLSRGRTSLPDETKAIVRSLTDTLQTKEEKIKVLYRYLQQKTRYVSIQIGIGGFQPFEAQVVDKFGYGDCKALSNYMVALLEVININSHYTLINAGDEAWNLLKDFPSTQFNHAVVVVPMESDSLWLECTSQTNPFGYMGLFTGRRNALAITDSGARVVRTPNYPKETNQKQSHSEIFIDGNGKATAKINTSYSGLMYEFANLNFILNSDRRHQSEWIRSFGDIPNVDVQNFSISQTGDKIPSAHVEVEATYDLLFSSQGKRLFFVPGLSKNTVSIPHQKSPRKFDVVSKMGFVNTDSILYHIPQDLSIESVPDQIRIESKFGTYEVSVIIDQGNIIYIRNMTINEGRFPPDSFKEIEEFYSTIYKNDNRKVVLKSKT